jgi:hypothetical protein
MDRPAPSFALAFPLLIGLWCDGAAAEPTVAASSRRPDILFVIMDDVGIDQLATFGFGGKIPPNTPTIDRIAAEGVQVQ